MIAQQNNRKKAILAVSFGTSYNDTREATIGAVERALGEAFPDYKVRRAFTSDMIIAKLRHRDGLVVDSVTEAMERLVRDGVEELLIQPTHVMNGSEHDAMRAEIEPFRDRFAVLRFGRPLLTDTRDYQDLVEVISQVLPVGSDELLVLVGHGSEHYANASYAALSYHFQVRGYHQVLVGTVEGFPDLADTLKSARNLAARRVILAPLMVVAGDHANNDIASDEEDSWKRRFEEEGFHVRCVMHGLGEYLGIQQLYVNHARDALLDGACAE